MRHENLFPELLVLNAFAVTSMINSKFPELLLFATPLNGV